MTASTSTRSWRAPARLAWTTAGLAALGCGLAGIVIPLVPTTPFLLLAAWAFARSSPRLHKWLVEHERFGRVLSQWREHRVIPPRAKAAGLVAVAAALSVSIAIGIPYPLLAVQAVVLCGVTVFLLSRPSRPPLEAVKHDVPTLRTDGAP